MTYAPTLKAQILASPVFDVANNAIGGIQKVVMTASRAIREEILPWKERISKVRAFDLAHTEGQGIMDDEGRIQIIQNTLKEARSVYQAMRATIRRANRATYKFQRQKRQLEVFNRLFGKAD